MFCLGKITNKSKNILGVLQIASCNLRDDTITSLWLKWLNVSMAPVENSEPRYFHLMPFPSRDTSLQGNNDCKLGLCAPKSQFEPPILKFRIPKLRAQNLTDKF